MVTVENFSFYRYPQFHIFQHPPPVPMSPKKIFALFVSLEIVIIVIAILYYGFSIVALQTITRFSGRLSLFLFSAIFLLYNKPDTIQTWLSRKFYLLFAIVHGIHLVELLSYAYLSGTILI